ncbi:hypothetical protein [Galbibacter orientalis]|uniref:hypothetical protein n=1 Tax=Galbibacter orientalis TaxID=453852 RepID=UPI0030806D9F
MEIKQGDTVLAHMPYGNIYAMVDAVLENGKYIITELKKDEDTGEYQPEGEPIKTSKGDYIEKWKMNS